MFDDRRQFTRQPVLIKASLRAGSQACDVVCINASPGGAFFSSRDQPDPGQDVSVMMKPHGPTAPTIELLCKVIHVTQPGHAQHPGFGVRWTEARSRVGTEPLRQLLRDVLKVPAGAQPLPGNPVQLPTCSLDQLPEKPSGDVTFHFLAPPPPTTAEPRAPVLTPPRPARRPVPTPAPAVGKTEGTAPSIRIPVPTPAAIFPCMSSTSTADALALLQVAPSPHVHPPHRGPWPDAVPVSLSERYANLTVTGTGGHGVVYRARDTLLDREVVLKFMRSSGLAADHGRHRFLREAKVAGNLHHPNIVELHDVAIAEGIIYYSMEFIDGMTLHAYLTQMAPVRDPAQVWSLMAQLLSAVGYAHAHGVLHLDIKPENVMVTEDGVLKLFDFGLARRRDEAFDPATMVGTPAYMAPEQVDPRRIDHRSDIYSLGIVLYRMITGVLPFRHGNLLAAHARDPVPDPRLYQADTPAAVVALVLGMLAKQPELRPNSCTEVSDALCAALFPQP